MTLIYFCHEFLYALSGDNPNNLGNDYLSKLIRGPRCIPMRDKCMTDFCFGKPHHGRRI